jgi:2-isopropylmalate synthase
MSGTEPLFEFESWRVISFKDTMRPGTTNQAVVKISVNGKRVHEVAEGNGPVDALAKVLVKALERFYPQVGDLMLKDYIVHIVNSQQGTEAEVKVMADFQKGNEKCTTTSTSTNILEATCDVFVQAIREFEGGQ